MHRPFLCPYLYSRLEPEHVLPNSTGINLHYPGPGIKISKYFVISMAGE